MARAGRIRSTKSFRRKPGRKPPRSITLIVCEGETERTYFDVARAHYGLTNAEVIIANNTEGSAPISVVRCAERKSTELGGYDKIYCVFDRDRHASFREACDKIRSLSTRAKKPLPIEEIVSIPCFEIWVLLHFDQTDAPAERCADVVVRIQNHMPNYRKADVTVARQLMNDVDTALINADWLERRAAANGNNPYTAVHRLLKYLQETARK